MCFLSTIMTQTLIRGPQVKLQDSSQGKPGAFPRSGLTTPGPFLPAASQGPELTLSAVMILARSSLFCIIKSYHLRSNELLSCKRNEAETQ